MLEVIDSPEAPELYQSSTRALRAQFVFPEFSTYARMHCFPFFDVHHVQVDPPPAGGCKHLSPILTLWVSVATCRLDCQICRSAIVIYFDDL